MAAARGEVKSPAAPKYVKVVTPKANGLFVTRIMIMEQNIMLVHSDGSVKNIQLNRMPNKSFKDLLYYVDPKTGIDTKLA